MGGVGGEWSDTTTSPGAPLLLRRSMGLLPDDPIRLQRPAADRRPRCAASLFPGKVHGSLARAGKVKGQTPKAEKAEKKKKPRGQSTKRHDDSEPREGMGKEAE